MRCYTVRVANYLAIAFVTSLVTLLFPCSVRTAEARCAPGKGFLH
jgi:hypothetical protein